MTELYSIVANGGVLSTRGLSTHGMRDLCVRVRQHSESHGAEEMLSKFAAYQVGSGAPFRSGDTVQHGFWTVVLRQVSGDVLEVYEFSPDGSEAVPGATSTLSYWRSQTEVCHRVGAPFAPAHAHQMAAISEGVLRAGSTVYGVRYRAPSHMSGWYLYNDEYNGDVKTLQVVHLYHVAANRPDVVPYLALPAGYRIAVGDNGDEVTFDGSGPGRG